MHKHQWQMDQGRQIKKQQIINDTQECIRWLRQQIEIEKTKKQIAMENHDIEIEEHEEDLRYHLSVLQELVGNKADACIPFEKKSRKSIA